MHIDHLRSDELGAYELRVAKSESSWNTCGVEFPRRFYEEDQDLLKSRRSLLFNDSSLARFLPLSTCTLPMVLYGEASAVRQ